MRPLRRSGRNGAPQHALPPHRSREAIEELVIGLLARSNAPISAYDIARHSVTIGSPLVPTQVYRTLARLMEQGLVMRLESLSAYMLRAEPFDSCLICDHCHSVQLLSNPEVVSRLRACAQERGFAISQTIIETHGHCADCATATRRADDHGGAQRPTPPSGV